MNAVDRPSTADTHADRVPDRPAFTELRRIPDTPADPRQYEGRYLTAEIKEALTRPRAEAKPDAVAKPEPVESDKAADAKTEASPESGDRPWTLDTRVGRDETAGDVLRRHHFGEASEQRELAPEIVRKNADYIAANVEKSPWLAIAKDADPLVQSVYVERDQSIGHDLQRHEGWRGDQGQHDRALNLRDPAHAQDSPEYLRSNDAFGKGRLHDCGRYATHIPDPVAYATTYARLTERPEIKAALATPFDPDIKLVKLRGIGLDEVLGPTGSAVVDGYRLHSDGTPREALNSRIAWVRAVRFEIDKDKLSPEEALDRVRDPADPRNLTEPTVEKIASFEGATIEVQFTANRAGDGYEIMSFHVNPREEKP